MGPIRRLPALVALVALALMAAPAAAKEGQPHVTIAVGGAACLCYLPAVLARELGAYETAGVDVELVNFKGGSQALTAVIGGSADVVSGYFDHCVIMAAKRQSLAAFATFDRFPGLVLVVSPVHAKEINSVRDLAGKTVGVTAPGSSTDFFVKYLLHKNGIDPAAAAIVGIGADATAVAAQEQGRVDAAVMTDPFVTVLETKYKDLKILSDTRTRKDTLDLFGGDYPAGALYTRSDWIAKHETETQALASAIVATLKWIRQHSAEEIMAKMPPDMVGPDKALYLAALTKTIPMYSETGAMDPKGAEAALAVLSQSIPEVAAAHIDVTKTYTNRFVEQALGKLGMK